MKYLQHLIFFFILENLHLITPKKSSKKKKKKPDLHIILFYT